MNHHKLMPPPRLPVGCGDFQGSGRPALPTLQGIDNCKLGEAGLFDQPRLGATRGLVDLVSQAHDYHGNDIDDPVNAIRPFFGNRKDYPLGMVEESSKRPDPWTRRKRFKELCSSWISTNYPDQPKMRANALLAEALGIGSINTLKQYTSGRNVPGRETFIKFCNFFNVPLSELWDDPNASPATKKSQEWKNSSDKARFVASAMFNGVLGEDLSDSEVDVLYSAYQNAIQTVKTLRDAKNKP